MTPRMACAIGGCGDTRGLRKEDRGVAPVAWICGAHWSLVPEAARAEYRRLQRLERRAAAQHGAPYRALTERAACVAAATALRGGMSVVPALAAALADSLAKDAVPGDHRATIAPRETGAPDASRDRSR